ncbi:MAG: BamA/TamA family outer membrane protein [Candidatus Edwardsbacteria bacterium]|nr:BamA/TamA family outer membrane protein [Candidatus Edwardsbacteria bacterium]
MKRIALIVLCCWAAHACGQELPVQKLSFDGNSFRSAGQLRKLMRLRWPGGRFDRDSLKKGLDRLAAYYAGQGFVDFRSEYLVTQDTARAAAEITVYLSEGSRYLISSVQFTGNERVAGDQLGKAIRARRGAPYDASALGQDDFNLMMLYADYGLIYAEVDHQVEVGENRDVRIAFRVNEGDPVRIGRIAVAGNRFVKTAAVMRELSLREGTLFSRMELAKSQAQLMATGLFKEAVVVPGALSPDSGIIDLDVQLRERPRHRLEAGIGYGSGDALRVTSNWSNRDLDGWGKSLEFSGQLAFQLWSQVKLVRGLVQAGYRDPWFLGRHRPTLVNLYYDDVRPAYTDYRLQTVGALIRTNLNTGRFVNTAVTWKQEWLKLSPGWNRPGNVADTLGYRGHRSVALSADFERTLDPVNPIQGVRGGIEAEYSGGLLGGINTLQRLNATAIVLGGPRSLPLMFGARLRLGIVGDWSRQYAVPVYEKFVLGGPATLRGFPLGMAGPLDSQGRPAGGDKMALLNLETKVRLYRNWRAVLFGDAGFVSDRSFNKVSLREAVGNPGVGLRYVLPIGSARLDLAAPWAQAGLIRKWRVVVAWGEAF